MMILLCESISAVTLVDRLPRTASAELRGSDVAAAEQVIFQMVHRDFAAAEKVLIRSCPAELKRQTEALPAAATAGDS